MKTAGPAQPLGQDGACETRMWSHQYQTQILLIKQWKIINFCTGFLGDRNPSAWVHYKENVDTEFAWESEALMNVHSLVFAQSGVKEKAAMYGITPIHK